MKGAKIFAACIALVVIAGCASSPVPTSKAKPVPADRMFAPASMRTPCDKCGTLIVKRDAHTIVGAPFSEQLFVNKTEIASLRPGEKVRIYLPAGYSVLSARILINVPTVAVEIKAGQTRVYRLSVIGPLGMGNLVIQPAVQ